MKLVFPLLTHSVVLLLLYCPKPYTFRCSVHLDRHHACDAGFRFLLANSRVVRGFLARALVFSVLFRYN